MLDLLINTFVLTRNTGIVTQSEMFSTVIRFEGESFPSLPHTEGWVFGVVFVLFVFMIFSVNRSYSWIVDAIKNITKVRNRSSIFSKTTVDEYQSRFLLTIFAVGVISLYVYLQFFPAFPLKFTTYIIFFTSGLFFIFLKEVIAKFIAYTFIDYELYKIASENYYNTLSFLGFILYPLLVLKIYFYDGMNVKLFDVLVIIFSLSALFFICVKFFQIFYRKILDFFHIMLYLCTLEILPLIGMYYAFKWVIKGF